MERCPNCGTPARPGAKFCTTCGFRFPGDASDSEPAQNDTDATASASDEEPGLFPGAMTDGWPIASPAGRDGSLAAGKSRRLHRRPHPLNPAKGVEVAATSNTWAAGAVDSWPARPAVAVAEPPPGEPEPQPDENTETQPVDTSDAATDNQTDTAEAVARAMRLLDELRQTISEIGPVTAPSISAGSSPTSKSR